MNLYIRQNFNLSHENCLFLWIMSKTNQIFIYSDQVRVLISFMSATLSSLVKVSVISVEFDLFKPVAEINSLGKRSGSLKPTLLNTFKLGQTVTTAS